MKFAVRVPRGRRAIAAVGLLIAALLAADAGWIHAKAALAQWLLQRAWTATLADGGVHRPWPWADTRPVARLQAPRIAIDQIVLAGDSGRVLAFGPGWAEASSAPGGVGTAVISGHRDTHFAWLAALQTGDALVVQTTHGKRRYRVTTTRVADTRRDRIALDPQHDQLLLVTCWPFDALIAGGTQRYVVTAKPEA